MARKLPEVYSSPDAISINLHRLLARLEDNLLSASADLKPLRQSRYHRARVGAVSISQKPVAHLDLTD